MQTLLDQVRTVEDEATLIIATAQKNGQQTLAAYTAQEPRALQDAQARATAKGNHIIAEAVQHPKQEANAINQDTARAIQDINRAAQKNEEATLTLAENLFNGEYRKM